MTALAQASMAVWLVFALLVFARLAIAPRIIRMDGDQCRRVALYGIAGVIGEAATLSLGGFW